VTLSVQTKGVRIVAETNRSNENAPTHRVYVGRAENRGLPGRSAPTRAATTSRSSWTIPPSNAPIFANLFDDEEGDGFTLIWVAPPASANGD